MQDQKTCQFDFKITPTNLIVASSTPSTPSLKSKLAPIQTNYKSILIKLGNKEGKCKAIGQSMEMNVDVIYSKTFRKFYPIKGIIKIYDVGRDGTEMILCVGAFNTEELLSEGDKIVNIERDIGPCKVSFKIEARNLTASKSNNQIQSSTAAQVVKNQSLKVKNQQILAINKNILNDDKKFTKSPKVSQSDPSQNPTPYMIDDSDIYDENSKSRCSEISDQVKLNEKELIGQQLLEERRKNKALQQKLEKGMIKIQLLRKNLAAKNTQIKSYYQNFKNFSAALEFDARGQYIFEMNEKKRQITLRYKQNIKFKQIFEQFISFMIKKLTEGNNSTLGSQRTIEDEAEVNKILSKIQNFDQEKKKNSQQNLKLITQLNNLKSQVNQKNIELSTKDILLRKKTQQISSLQQKVRRISEQKRGLQGLNQYLQERDHQMQTIITTKQNTIQSLKKMITDHNFEVDSLEEKNSKLVKIVQNLQCKVQELNQQTSTLQETIEKYRENYGDLKSAKDRALEREFKQCLRWIDQQNHEQDMNIEDTIESTDSPTVNSIMKSIGQIQNMPLQQISQIRKEVINVLKRLDQFVVKNSFGMSP